MAKMTINEVMVMMKAIRGRLAELSNLRSQSASKETYYGTPERVIEPKYDIKALDKKCVELENWILDADSKVKQSNAVTTIELDADVKVLLSPLS
ncbi:MAG: hypothetical protein WC208_08420 [Gallionella sp.]|jgi:hypothetical protein